MGSSRAGQLGSDGHRDALITLGNDPSRCNQLVAIATAQQEGRLEPADARSLDHLLDRATRPTGPFDDLQGLPIPGTNKRISVIYPGQDAELRALGEQMRNCIRHYTTDGFMTFREGALLAIVDAQGRASEAIELTPARTIRQRASRGRQPIPPGERDQIDAALRQHGVDTQVIHEVPF